MKPAKVSLRQLEFFVAAAEAGTMSGAAEVYRVSQSAVSLAIAQLERTLGVQLFLRRKSRGLALTPQGADLLGDARHLLRQTADLENSARTLGQGVAGLLVVGLLPTLTPFLMPRILQDFPRRHPGVDVDFLEGSTEQLREWLLTGRCEAALTYLHRIPELSIGPDIATTLLHRARPQVLVAADHPLASNGSLWLRQVADEPMIMLDLGPSAQYYSTMLRSAGVTPTIRHRTTSFESVRSLVARGIGWSLLVQRPAIDLSYEALPVATLQIRDDIEELDVVLAVPADTRQTNRTRAFTDFCLQTAAAPR